jgi:hypothetical protein
MLKCLTKSKKYKALKEILLLTREGNKQAIVVQLTICKYTPYLGEKQKKSLSRDDMDLTWRDMYSWQR